MTDKHSNTGRPDSRNNHSDNRTTFAALYDNAVESLLDIPTESGSLQTAAGNTHVLTAGDPANPPVVIFQGGNVTTPITLAWFQALAEEYYLVAPDTPGQPGKSAGKQPSRYGSWVSDVLDGLGIDRAAMIGSSHGGGVLLATATQCPERITAAALVVPGGFNTTPSLDISKTLSPTLMYQMMPQRWLLRQAIAPIFTQQPKDIDPVVLDTIGWVLRNETLTATCPGPRDLSGLSDFLAPTVVITGTDDPFFPGNQICHRAGKVLPSLVECLSLQEERHFLSPAAQDQATERIRALFRP